MPHTKETRLRAWEKMKSIRKAFFFGKTCVVCSSEESLELDHIDPAQKKTHKIWSWNEIKRNAELAKCQILCKKCHRNKTNEYLKEIFTKPIKHGTANGYYHKKCRCELCRTARNIYRRSLKEKNGKW